MYFKNVFSKNLSFGSNSKEWNEKSTKIKLLGKCTINVKKNHIACKKILLAFKRKIKQNLHEMIRLDCKWSEKKLRSVGHVVSENNVSDAKL